MYYQDQGKNEEAEEGFRRAVKINPKNPVAARLLRKFLLGLGSNSYQQGKFDDSIKYFNEVLELAPTNFDAFINLGAAYYSKGKYDDAVKNYLKAIEINPKHAGAHYNLGLSYSALGKPEPAKVEYQKACDLGMKESCVN
jgi:tetratricopeptide (TPR) repeat protein